MRNSAHGLGARRKRGGGGVAPLAFSCVCSYIPYLRPRHQPLEEPAPRAPLSSSNVLRWRCAASNWSSISGYGGVRLVSRSESHSCPHTTQRRRAATPNTPATTHTGRAHVCPPPPRTAQEGTHGSGGPTPRTAPGSAHGTRATCGCAGGRGGGVERRRGQQGTHRLVGLGRVKALPRVHAHAHLHLHHARFLVQHCKGSR